MRLKVAFFLYLLFVIIPLQAKEDVLDQKIRITKNKGTRYQLLRHVSDLSGYLFIYESKLISNDKEVKIRKGEYSLRNAIYKITGNKELNIRLIGNHLLLSSPSEEQPVAIEEHPATEEPDSYFTVEGTLFDRISEETIPYGSISVSNSTIGTVSNTAGEFKLVIPDSLNEATIKLSHLGYENREFKASLLANRRIDISLEPNIIPLQEVVVRIVNPLRVLNEMLDAREQNYATEPVYLTAFYREGTEHKKQNVDLTESVLKIYKPGYKDPRKEEVKLIKMRRTFIEYEKDSILTKMKSGISSTLLLDIIKYTGDFLEPTNSFYTYAHTDIAIVDDRQANVISFEQQPNIKEPLYKGRLFIDTENHALLKAVFEVNPERVEKATNQFIVKKSKGYNFTLKRAVYNVSYRPSEDGLYYINHVRGDLEFRVRKKKHLFGSTLKMWFEMVNCKTETENVKSLSSKERFSPRTIFSETKFKYDEHFWKHFNIIVPEEKLKEMIVNNLNETTGSSE